MVEMFAPCWINIVRRDNQVHYVILHRIVNKVYLSHIRVTHSHHHHALWFQCYVLFVVNLPKEKHVLNRLFL